MNKQANIAVNFILFQIGWFACVLMAARDNPDIGVIIGLSLVCVHLILTNGGVKNLLFLGVITLVGFSWDSALTYFNVLVFSTGMILPFLAPKWILVMWLIFATTLNVSFRWLHGRYLMAMLLGALCGPMAYQAGAALGAVEIPDNLLANSVMALGWSLLMPLFIKLADMFDDSDPQRDMS